MSSLIRWYDREVGINRSYQFNGTDHHDYDRVLEDLAKRFPAIMRSRVTWTISNT